MMKREVLEQLPPSSQLWADRIAAAYSETIAGIFECGELLLKAKEEVGRGRWERFKAEMLNFSPDTAERLMRIARSPNITNPAILRHLPNSYSTLEILARLKPENFNAGIKANYINPDMTAMDAALLVRNQPHIALRIEAENAKDPSIRDDPNLDWEDFAHAPYVPPLLAEIPRPILKKHLSARISFAKSCDRLEQLLGFPVWEQELEYIAGYFHQRHQKYLENPGPKEFGAQ